MAKTPVNPVSNPVAAEPSGVTAARKAAKAAAIAEAYASPSPATSPAPAETATESRGSSDSEDLKLKELVEAAVMARGLKKSDAKPAIEAAMEVLGAALAEGRDINLPGLGKVKIKRSKTTGDRRVIELRLRQKA